MNSFVELVIYFIAWIFKSTHSRSSSWYQRNSFESPESNYVLARRKCGNDQDDTHLIETQNILQLSPEVAACNSTSEIDQLHEMMKHSLMMKIYPWDKTSFEVRTRSTAMHMPEEINESYLPRLTLRSLVLCTNTWIWGHLSGRAKRKVWAIGGSNSWPWVY